MNWETQSGILFAAAKLGFDKEKQKTVGLGAQPSCLTDMRDGAMSLSSKKERKER